MTPSQAYLADVERAFSVTFPEAFHVFCRRQATENLVLRGSFITDLSTLEAINTQIGTEEWGDYERILAGKAHPKSGKKLWGGLLPFYFDPTKRKQRRQLKLADMIHGFAIDTPGSDKVLVWSVHCVVHGYPTLEAWLNSHAQ